MATGSSSPSNASGKGQRSPSKTLLGLHLLHPSFISVLLSDRLSLASLLPEMVSVQIRACCGFFMDLFQRQDPSSAWGFGLDSEQG